MGHFCTAVFSHRPADVAKLMQPYEEKVVPGAPYACFHEHSNAPVDEITGRHGFWLNLAYKLDWWCIGGRYNHMIKLQGNPECKISQAKVNECNFTPDEDAYRKAANHWNFILLGIPMPNGERAPTLHYSPNYYLKKYGTQENYALAMSGFYPDAFINEHGEWEEPEQDGEDRSDAVITPEARKHFLQRLEKQLQRAAEIGLYITICDCHI